MANPRSLLAAVALCAGLVPAAAAAEKSTAAALAQCKSPAAGTFVVLGSGQQRGEPTALLMQERWFADGRIEGVRYLRGGAPFCGRSLQRSDESRCQLLGLGGAPGFGRCHG